MSSIVPFGHHAIASRILLNQIIAVFSPSGVLVIGIDDTIERRKGKRIAAKSIYRDPVRSSESHFVKVSGLHWLSMMLLVEISWAQRVWALRGGGGCSDMLRLLVGLNRELPSAARLKRLTVTTLQY